MPTRSSEGPNGRDSPVTRSSPSKNAAMRASSSLLRLVRPSSSALFTKTPDASDSVTKSKPARIRGRSDVVAARTPTHGLPRPRAATPLPTSTPIPQFLETPTGLTALRTRRRSASVPARGETVASAPLTNTPKSMYYTPPSRLEQLQSSPTSQLTTDDDPFRYSPLLGKGAQITPQKQTVAHRFDSPSNLPPYPLSRPEPVDRSGGRSKSTSDITGRARNPVGQGTPTRSQSNKAYNATRSVHEPTLRHAPPAHRAVQSAKVASLRSTPPLGRQNSPQLNDSSSRYPIGPHPRLDSPDLSKRVFRPMVTQHTPSHSPSGPYGLGISPEGFSKHVKPMLSRSSSDGQSFKMIAMLGREGRESGLSALDDAGSSRGRVSPQGGLRQTSPASSITPRAESPIGVGTWSRQNVPSTRPLTLKSKESGDRMTQGRNLIAASSAPHLPNPPLEPPSRQSSDDQSEGDTSADLSFGKTSATSSSLASYQSSIDTVPSSGSWPKTTTADTTDPTPWLSVIPPSPTKDSSRRRGLIFTLDSPLLVATSETTPERRTEEATGHTPPAQNLPKAQVSALTAQPRSNLVARSRPNSGAQTDDDYTAVALTFDSYFEGADTSGGTIRPPSPLLDSPLGAHIKGGVSFLPSVVPTAQDTPSRVRPGIASDPSPASSPSSVDSYYHTPASAVAPLAFSPSGSATSLLFPGPHEPENSSASSNKLKSSLRARSATVSPASSTSSLLSALQNTSLGPSGPHNSLSESMSPTRSHFSRSPSPSPSHTSFVPAKPSPLSRSTSSLQDVGGHSWSSEGGGSSFFGDVSFGSLSAVAKATTGTLWASGKGKLRDVFAAHGSGRNEQDEQESGTRGPQNDVEVVSPFSSASPTPTPSAILPLDLSAPSSGKENRAPVQTHKRGGSLGGLQAMLSRMRPSTRDSAQDQSPFSSRPSSSRSTLLRPRASTSVGARSRSASKERTASRSQSRERGRSSSRD